MRLLIGPASSQHGNHGPISNRMKGILMEGTSMIRTELYFGRSVPGHPDVLASAGLTEYVSDSQVGRFLRQSVATRFDGFTVAYVEGFWRGEREDSIVVTILHNASAQDDTRIEDIRDAYRAAFAQQSVLRVDSVASVRF